MTFKILPCAKRWNFASVDLSTRMVRTCVRAFGPSVSREEVATYGKDIFLNHPYMKKGRELMLKGEYQEDCKGCYPLLESSYDGFRTSHEQTILELAGAYKEKPEKLARNFRNVPFDEKYLHSREAIELEVGFGNICDMACIYCSPNYSSNIEAETKKWDDYTPEFARSPIEDNQDFLDAFWTWIEKDSLRTIRNIHLIGGETLFNNYFYVFLRNLDQIYRKNKLKHEIGINVFSNLNNTASVNTFIESVKGLHPQLKIRMMFSNESTGNKAEFIRSGMNWENVTENVKRVLEVSRIELGFSPSFNSLSISSATEFLGFIRELQEGRREKFYCGDNYINYPYGFSPFILTVDFIPFIDETLRYIRTVGPSFLREESAMRLANRFESIKETILKNHVNPDSQLVRDRKDFSRRMNLLKERRNMNVEETFPEYAEFYKLCVAL